MEGRKGGEMDRHVTTCLLQNVINFDSSIIHDWRLLTAINCASDSYLCHRPHVDDWHRVLLINIALAVVVVVETRLTFRKHATYTPIGMFLLSSLPHPRLVFVLEQVKHDGYPSWAQAS